MTVRVYNIVSVTSEIYTRFLKGFIDVRCLFVGNCRHDASS